MGNNVADKNKQNARSMDTLDQRIESDRRIAAVVFEASYS